MKPRLAMALCFCLVVAAACGDDDIGDAATAQPDSTTTTTTATMTNAAATTAASLATPATAATTTTNVSTTTVGGGPRSALPVLVDVDVPYSSRFALDVYHPDASGPWPVAVVFHGGEVSKSSVRTYASQVAEQGVVVFVPEYSSTPEQLSETLHAGAQDAVCAMRYARAHASDFDGSSDRIATAGASYGANVAALMVLASDKFEGDCLVGSEVSAIADGLVGLDGMYDFTELPRVLGFYDYYTVEEMQRASAITYIDQAEPGDGTAIVLFTGREPASQHQAGLFRDGLTAAGYEVLLVPQPDLPHSAYGGAAPGTVDALADMAYG